MYIEIADLLTLKTLQAGLINPYLKVPVKPETTSAKAIRRHSVSTKAECTTIASALPEGTTTLMLRRVPRQYSLEVLKKELEEEGYKFDFLHVSRTEARKRSRGFCFVNFVDHETARRFYEIYNDGMLKHAGSMPLSICAADLQGRDANWDHYHGVGLGHLPWFS